MPAPANTPVADPFSFEGSIPACSSASHEVSSMTRCCGSIASASRGLIPKNPASKPDASWTNPPWIVFDDSSRGPAEPYRPSTSQPRSVGKSAIASVPEDSSRQKLPGSFTPPGKRQPIPTIAIGSASRSSSSRTRLRALRRSAVARLR
ncbi:hypothetical protein Kisp01_35960 [Kineosporia sp. NBRC 101677]|nr:hypothetical protein Kisp01_35960 [Kineosporia sp. NBRC 101677]